MWRRTYLLLVLIRLWFALSPSYLHPDENFQGPEVIAGMFPHQSCAVRPWSEKLAPGRNQRTNTTLALSSANASLPAQAKSSATQSDAHGNSRATTRYEASFLYGPSTGCRCCCCGGCGSVMAKMAKYLPSPSSGRSASSCSSSASSSRTGRCTS